MSVIFLTLIFSPSFKLCGSSVSIVTVVPETVALSINLKFLLTLNLVLAAGSNVVSVRSASSIAPVLLDSWMINPSSGFLPWIVSFGITTRNL